MAQSKSDKKKRRTVGGGLGSKVSGMANKVRLSAPVFSVVTWVIQFAIQFMLMFTVTLFGAAYAIPQVCVWCGGLAEGYMDFYYLTVGFVLIVMALVCVRVYAAAWRALSRWLGGLRSDRKAALAEKHGVE